VHEDQHPVPHKRVVSFQGQLQSSKLQKVAKTMVIDTQIKTAEDMIMVERKKNMGQLKAIKEYLLGIKTGEMSKKAHFVRNSSTKVERKGMF
jgi:hypothetical protein